MKRKLILSLLLLTLCVTVGNSQFLYQRKLDQIKVEGWYQVTVPSSVLTKLKSDFSDLRLYPVNIGDSLEVPYLLKIRKDETETVQATIIPFNESRKNKALFFTIANTTQDALNTAELVFENKNYQAWVSIEGSNDQKSWFEIADSAKIISLQQGPLQYEYNRIDFPISNYRYLRFQVKSKELLTLSGVTFFSRKVNKGSYAFSTRNFTREEKSKESILTTQKNQSELISKVVICAEDGQMFYRNLRVEYLTDSAKTENGWHYYYQPIQTSIFNSFHADTLEFEPQLLNQLRIVIENNDNPPVKIKSINTFSPEVQLISYLKPGTYKLVYGNPKVYAPNYDLAHFEKGDIRLNESLLQSEEKLEVKSEQKSLSWFENKIWLWSILLIIVGVLGYFTVQMMRKV
jgi:hypothetical protein